MILVTHERGASREKGMKYNLKKVRESYKYSQAQMAEFIGVSKGCYRKFEQRGELPSKYVYVYWTKLKDFPLPNDFFWYTSYTLLINMKIHKMKQADVARMFGIPRQSTISNYLGTNRPMYEKKEYFDEFDPLYVPVYKNGDTTAYITCLDPRGNFISAEHKRKKKMREKAEK